MTNKKQEQQRAALFENLLGLARKKMPAAQVDLFGRFINYYYATTAVEDLIARNLSDLFGAVLSHWKLIYQRQPDQVVLKIYNPSFEDDGWVSNHTVIELAHDDMPFLVDSIQNALNKRDITTHIIVHAGGIKVKRDEKNCITEVLPVETEDKNCSSEALIFIEIDRQTNPAILTDLENSILGVLEDVRLAVSDWPLMREKLNEIIISLEHNSFLSQQENLRESIGFLQWLLADNFIFLGYRCYSIEEQAGEKVLLRVDESGLGILRRVCGKKISKHFSEMPFLARQEALSAQLLIISKSRHDSRVHRGVKLDVISIKILNEKGVVIGEHRLLGLYTSIAYHTQACLIPFLRSKLLEVIKRSQLSPFSHAGKTLVNILETLPRDDLFQASVEELLDLAMGIFHLQERRKIRLFVRQDLYAHFLSCFVYVPKDRYSTKLAKKMQKVISKAFAAEEVIPSTLIGESVLARLHFTVRINPQKAPEYDVKAIEDALILLGKQWDDELKLELIEYCGEERGVALFSEYRNAFPSNYQENFSVRNAVYDIDRMEVLKTETDLAISLFRPLEEQENRVRLKLFRLKNFAPLSETLPILENMGFRVLSEQPYRICRVNDVCAWINDFTLEAADGACFSIEKIKRKFEALFLNVWFEKIESDQFNRLMLTANLDWREIALLRAYSRYLKQIKFTFSQPYIANTLAKNPALSGYLIQLFTVRFDIGLITEESRELQQASIEKNILTALDNVLSLDEDKIIRCLMELILATLRSNYYQKDESGAYKSYFSIKLASHQISNMPLPLPKYEIFVYSASVEGIHLRSALVARGGIRWSDRPEDFRTEILGLMKAQNVKNAVIVPSGAKGGFVTKRLPVTGSREEVQAAVIANYKTFISGLLDLTDNIVDGEILSPKDVLCYDGEDPYLVVAADKGTATFSDEANQVAENYQYWMMDAFASGGSTGYDHKKMGITARGAWESVKRHFRELNRNIQQEPFTVIGVGDMSGDVFGNGMLLSEKIRLVAAFNHLHIFIDPNPDPKLSFEERKRLFALPRSMWTDYDMALISEGGGVFSRSTKSIVLSAEIKTRFCLEKDKMEPNELLHAILQAPVDLFWNGGIGTFVKSSHEINEQVGDKLNDAIRINATELKAKVVVEAGNLGLTQLGRVEYSLRGGRVFTDFIDNSAGVNCSDEEVNLKILLNSIVAAGDMTMKQRNHLLSTMTDEVAKLVLKNNYWQTQAISLALRQVVRNHDLYVRFIQKLEQTQRLNRKLEFIPDEKTLQERKGQSKTLTAPEMCVLLAYSKMALKDAILASQVPEDAYLSNIIITAFPAPIREKYTEQMLNHSLRREIIATQLSNVIINKMGMTYVTRMQEETGASVAVIVSAYAIAHEIFNAGVIWEQIEALDNVVAVETQMEMMLTVSRLLRRASRWLLRHHRNICNIQSIIDVYAPHIAALEDNIHLLVGGAAKNYVEGRFNFYLESNVPKELARRVAMNEVKFSLLDIISASQTAEISLERYAKTYFLLGFNLELAWLRASIMSQYEETHWEVLAKAALRDDIDWQQRLLTVNVLVLYQTEDSVENVIKTWLQEHEDLMQRWQGLLLELKSSNTIEFVKYAVAIRELTDLTQACAQELQSV